MNKTFFLNHVEQHIIKNGVPIQQHAIDRIGNNNIVYVREKHNNNPTIKYIEKRNIRFQEPYVKLSNKIDRMPTPYFKSKQIKKSKKNTKGKTRTHKKLKNKKSSKHNKSKKQRMIK